MGYAAASDREVSTSAATASSRGTSQLAESQLVPIANESGISRVSGKFQAERRELLARLPVDPEGALRYAEQNLSATRSIEARAEMLTILASRDLAGVAEYLAGLPRGPEHVGIVNRLIYRLIDDAPETAIALLETQKTDDDRYLMIHRIAEGLTDRDPDIAFRWVSGLTGDDQETALLQTLSALAVLDPVACAKRVQSLAEGKIKTNARYHLAKAWGARDIKAAFAWYEANQNDPDSPLIYETLMTELVTTHPADVGQYLKQIGNSRLRETLELKRVGAWARISPKECAAYVGQMEGEQRTRAVKILVDQWSQQDLEESMLYVQSLDSDQRNQVIGGIVAQAIRKLPMNDVVAHVRSVADPVARDRSFSQLSREWLARDELAATKWIFGQSESGDRDAALRAYCEHFEVNDPARAFAGALALQDEGFRRTSLMKVFRSWAEVDKGAALAALQNGRLSDSERAEVAAAYQ